MVRLLSSWGATGLAVWLAAACSLQDVDELKGNPKVADSGTTDGSTAADSGVDADADGSACREGGTPCQSYNECCSQTCVEGACASCTGPGDVCVVSSDCCGQLTCYLEICTTCAADGSTCSSSSDCCSGICGGGTCQACGVIGEDCSPSEPCCDGATCSLGKCQPESCQECIATKCPDEMTACFSEPACADAWACQQACACAGGDVQTCAGQCNAGSNTFLALGVCVLNEDCEQACTDNIACN